MALKLPLNSMDTDLCQPVTNAVRFVSLALLNLFLFFCSPILAAPANDNFVNAIILPAGPSLTTGTTVGATRQSGEPTTVDSGYGWGRVALGTNSVWWKWTSPSNYVVKFATSNGSDNNQFDSQLGVYTGSSVTALTEIASNDDRPLYSNGGSDVLIPAVQGTTYYILVAGYDSITGPVKLYRTDAAMIQLKVTREPEYFLISGSGEWRGTVSLQSSTNLTEWSLVGDYNFTDWDRSFAHGVELNSPTTYYRAVVR